MSALLRESSQPSSSPSERPLASALPSVCFVGMGNLPVLAREYNHHSIGGEQVQQTLLAKAFAARGYRVGMVTADYGQQDATQWEGVTVYKAFAPSAGLPGLRFFHPRWTGLWSALGRANADVYYTSCSSAAVGQIAMFCRRHGRAFIFRAASDVDCSPDRLLMKLWRDRELYRYGLQRADAVLVQSEYQRQQLQKSYGVPSSVARMLVEAGPADTPFGQRDLPVLWVNNLRWMKRPALFVELAERLPELSFHMAGGAAPGEGSFFEQARALAATRPNITMIGQVPYHDVHELYGRARVHVNTSEFEGFPNSYIQAWASGTPVVAFFDPDGLIASQGLGVNVRSMDEMSAAVKLLASDEGAWRAASDRCRAFAAREFNEDIVLKPYREAVFASAASRPDSRATQRVD